MQNYRAIMSLLIITGNFDRKGSQLPVEFSFMERASGFHTHEEEFMNEKYAEDAPKAIGSKEFPLWYYLRHDMQANKLADNILRQDENSVKVLLGLGMNYRMFTGEVLAITILTAVPGITFMSLLLHAMGQIEFFADSFRINPLIAGLSFLIILVFNLLAGLFPVFRTLRKTPVAILSRNDVN